MTNTTEIVPGVIFYSYYAAEHMEKACFVEQNMLVLQVSGQFSLETATENIAIQKGEMLLVRKNQLAHLTKRPLTDQRYQTIVIFLLEDMLRKIALEEQIPNMDRYAGAPNIVIPKNEFLYGFFQSVVPYVQNPYGDVSASLGALKVREVVQLLLQTMPALKEFLFDFSEPYKIDLEKFMQRNFHFNVPIEKFARLTGRSLAGFKRDFQKTFSESPRQWLQERRLTEARYLMEKKKLKPSNIYLDLGFESLSHFSHAFKKKFGKTPTAWMGT